jgi:hypothetical protein
MDFEEQYDKLNQADKLVAGGWLLVCQCLIYIDFYNENHFNHCYLRSISKK